MKHDVNNPDWVMSEQITRVFFAGQITKGFFAEQITKGFFADGERLFITGVRRVALWWNLPPLWQLWRP